MRKIKHLSCHWGSWSQRGLRTSDSSFWHIHTAGNSHFLFVFCPYFFLNCLIFLQNFVAKIFACPLAVFIVFSHNFLSKPHPTLAILCKERNYRPVPIAPCPATSNQTQISLPSSHLWQQIQPIMSLPCLPMRYLLYLPTCSASEFVCSHLYAHQSISYASGFAFIRCIPHLLTCNSISLQGRFFPLETTNDYSARSASLVIYSTSIYLFLQQVPEGRGFSSLPCTELVIENAATIISHMTMTSATQLCCN